MIHPPSSHLPESTRNRVLYLVGQLRKASRTVANNHFGAGGRLDDKATATRRWAGPHRDTFESLFDAEAAAAHATQRDLADEAEAWARFWAGGR